MTSIESGCRQRNRCFRLNCCGLGAGFCARIASALAILLFASFAHAAGAKKKQEPVKLTADELRELSKAKPDQRNAAKLFSASKWIAEDEELRQAYLIAASACVIACDRYDIYKKNIKSKMRDSSELEDVVLVPCEKCAGKGVQGKRCTTCKGSGSCTSCKGAGQKVKLGLNGSSRVNICSKCGGSGRCQKCQGGGLIGVKCKACKGDGKKINKATAEKIYSESCVAIGKAIDTIKKAKSEESVETTSAQKNVKKERPLTNEDDVNAQKHNADDKAVSSSERPDGVSANVGDKGSEFINIYKQRDDIDMYGFGNDISTVEAKLNELRNDRLPVLQALVQQHRNFEMKLEMAGYSVIGERYMNKELVSLTIVHNSSGRYGEMLQSLVPGHFRFPVWLPSSEAKVIWDYYQNEKLGNSKNNLIQVERMIKDGEERLKRLRGK